MQRLTQESWILIPESKRLALEGKMPHGVIEVHLNSMAHYNDVFDVYL
jgi:hypothetical protein